MALLGWPCICTYNQILVYLELTQWFMSNIKNHSCWRWGNLSTNMCHIGNAPHMLSLNTHSTGYTAAWKSTMNIYEISIYYSVLWTTADYICRPGWTMPTEVCSKMVEPCLKRHGPFVAFYFYYKIMLHGINYTYYIYSIQRVKICFHVPFRGWK